MLAAATDRLQGLARVWSRRSVRERRIQVFALVVGIAVFAAIAAVRGATSAVQLVGYPGVFLISVLGSANTEPCAE